MDGHNETWRDAEDTGSLSVFRWDHCDLLLDAIDVQLDQLQIQPPTEHNPIKPATLRWNHSGSKDMGLGSTTQTNNTSISCLELIHTPMMKKSSEITACSSVCHNKTIKRIKRNSSDEEKVESEWDQVTWRLQRLLGDVCQEGTSGETHPASDSICTEDFIWCFREEMVGLSLSDMEQLNDEGNAGISESDTKPSDQNLQVAECGVNVSQVKEGAQRHGSCSEFSYRTEVVPNSENVSSDSDADAVCTERVKQHSHKWTGPIITDLNEFDTTTQDETEHLSASVRSSSGGRVDEAQSNGTKTSRKEASTSGRTSEKMDRNETKKRLENLQQKCENEERKLKMEWTHLKDVEVCLSELRQRKKHAVQHLSADSAQMDKEKEALEFVLGDSRAEKESISNQLQKQSLQIHKASPHKQTLEEGSCKNTKQDKTVMSEVECEEMERQLDCTQTELFTEQRRAQEKVKSLQKEVQLAVRESDRLWAMLEDKTSAHERFRAETEKQLRLWAQQLAAELKHLHLLVDHNRDLPQSFTLTEAVAHLRTTREQLQHVVRRLHQQLDSQKQMNEHLRKEKEQELSVQRQQLRSESDQALNSIRIRLIREHVEELSSLKWAHVSETGGVAACLRRQLQDKDLELRQLQRSMAEWKRRTAACLASKFEDQLTAELERCKVALMRSRRASKTREVRPSGEGTHSSKENVCSHWIHAVDSAAAHISTDVVSLKLLRHLQGKVKRLRVETQAQIHQTH